MPIGQVVGRLLMMAAVTVQKWAVLPLSATAVRSGGIRFGGGGPMTTVEDKLKPESLHVSTLGGIGVGGSGVDRIGSPRRQRLGEAVRRGRPEEIVLFPPRMRKAVASS